MAGRSGATDFHTTEGRDLADPAIACSALAGPHMGNRHVLKRACSLLVACSCKVREQRDSSNCVLIRSDSAQRQHRLRARLHSISSTDSDAVWDDETIRHYLLVGTGPGWGIFADLDLGERVALGAAGALAKLGGNHGKQHAVRR